MFSFGRGRGRPDLGDVLASCPAVLSVPRKLTAVNFSGSPPISPASRCPTARPAGGDAVAVPL
ncbi:hypothetical protein NXT3_PC00034 (plasmid) [Sinorhizobium fredii]|uniref:Uncharacterized protein n=1 Tax=Rhizobium fredii TaxID=380 RepID=A0A2L0HCM1_RHIFR|nr:hypothetical protein NXT3_PC00034 [Sinorhizobium fredii]